MEKKSRFIATVSGVSSEEEAHNFIESVRKRYWDASHNCYAYVVGGHRDLNRFSDDREPSGTAGKPILEVLLNEGLYDSAIVVTRYFGGTLLGAGGLIRAYTRAAKAGLASSVIITRISGVKLTIMTDYSGLGRIQHILGSLGLHVIDAVYTEKAEIRTVVPDELLVRTMAEIRENTNGKAELETAGPCFFADVNNRIITWE